MGRIDEVWHESDHPRDKDGKFTEGTGHSEGAPVGSKERKKLLSAGRPAGVRLISSQRYRDPDRVEEKRENHDYTVTISPPFDLDGETYQIVIDGHHSLQAALEDDETPDFVVATPQDDDRIGMLENGDIDGFLEAEYMDDSWYDLEDEVEVW